MTSVLLPAVVLGLFALAAIAAVSGRLAGPRAGYPLAAALAVAFAAIAAQAPTVLSGTPMVSSASWLPTLDIRFALRLDALGLLFSLLTLGIGAVVIAYCPRYLAGHVGRAGRFYGLMLGFAASMVGLVLAADAVLFYLFWELTSVSSFLLISHERERSDRRAAEIALLVTVLGGLCLLAAVLLAGVSTGSFDLQRILTAPSLRGPGAVGATIVALVLVAAFTKSAQAPFHVWLPAAMVAPTPVSAYLHAAAMVKAGVYLLARVSPLLGAHPRWAGLAVGVGLATAVFASAVAFVRADLKVILAYSTIGQLGLITALLGVGSFAAVAAAMLHVVTHAFYKSTLFLVAGVVEHEAGTRDVGVLGGLHRTMPLTTATAALGVASMMGLPPLLGFVSEEEAVKSLLEGMEGGPVQWLVVGAAVAAVMLTTAYSLRLFVAAFPGGPRRGVREAAWPLVAAPALTAIGGVLLGVFSPRLSGLIASVAQVATGSPDHLKLGLWHGATPAFWLSVIATAAGIALVVARAPLERASSVLTFGDGAGVVEAMRGWVSATGRLLTQPALSTTPAWHLTTVLAAATAAGAAAWMMRPPTLPPPLGQESLEQWVLVAILGVACVGVARAADRMAAVAVLAIVGFLMAGLYVLQGAPDLVLTQLVVDALAVALIVFVFRHLPQAYPPVTRARALGAAAVAALVGVLTAAGTSLLVGRRDLSAVAAFYLETSPVEGGKNVVNTILTDFRALDTLGELAVLAVAATGVVALIRASGKEPP